VSTEVHIRLNNVVWVTLYPSSDPSYKVQTINRKFAECFVLHIGLWRLLKKKHR
jgi:hypothetical protein